MCTVTFSPRATGYLLGMNRDEKLARVTGRLPALGRSGTRAVLSPSEPNGGTWISLNDRGLSFALINWYSVNSSVPRGAISRGQIIPAVRCAQSSADVETRLRRLSLNRINPFRLIVIFPNSKEVFEWRWDLNRVQRKRRPWRAQQWISSGFNEKIAQNIRDGIFRQRRWRRSKSNLGLAGLRRLHSSHLPQKGPFSTCMHREEAATVSYTEIVLAADEAVMRHHVGPTCQGPLFGRHADGISLRCNGARDEKALGVGERTEKDSTPKGPNQKARLGRRRR